MDITRDQRPILDSRVIVAKLETYFFFTLQKKMKQKRLRFLKVAYVLLNTNWEIWFLKYQELEKEKKIVKYCFIEMSRAG